MDFSKWKVTGIVAVAAVAIAAIVLYFGGAAVSMEQPATPPSPMPTSEGGAGNNDHPLVSHTKQLDLGEFRGDTLREFGRIADLASDQRNRIYIVDQAKFRLSVFDSAGSFVTAMGRQGSGPEEFQYLASIDLDDDGDIHVLDRLNSRIYTYILVDSGFVLRNVLSPLPLDPKDFCNLGGRYFLAAYSDGALIHELGSDGSIVRSFGNPFFDDPALGSVVDRLMIECVDDSETILLAAQQFPFLRAYSTNGKLIWSKEIDGFNRMQVEPVPGGAMYSAPKNGEPEDLTTSLTYLDKDVAVMQFGRVFRGMREVEDILDVTTHFFSVKTGEELFDTAELPRIDEANQFRTYSRGNNPFSRVVAYDYDLRGVHDESIQDPAR